MAKGEVSLPRELRKTYFNAGLFHPEKLPSVVVEIKASGSDGGDVLADLERRLVGAKVLAEKAGQLAVCGVERQSLEINDLKEEMKTLVGPEFCSIIYQSYDKVKESHGSSGARPGTSATAGACRSAVGAKRDSGAVNGAGQPERMMMPVRPFPKLTGRLDDLAYEYAKVGLWSEKGAARDDAMQKARGKLKDFLASDPGRAEKLLAELDEWLLSARQLQLEYCQLLKKPAVADDQLQRLKKLAQDAGEPLLSSLAKEEKYRENLKKITKALNSYGVPRITNHGPRVASGQPVTVPAMSHGAGPRPLAYRAHQNDITHLQPSGGWALLIDESGSDFDGAGNGLIAGVLIPADHPLPAISPSLHAASDSSKADILRGDQALARILNGPYGVLALPVKAFRSTGDWAGAIGSFIDLVLRMLPLAAEQKTTVDIQIEGRGPYSRTGDFSFIRDACRYKLMHMLPERANLLAFNLSAMDKTSMYDSYPDLVSHTCYSKSSMAKNRLKITGWVGSCFLNYPAAQIGNALDYYYTSRLLPAADWAALLKAYDAGAGASLVDGLLNTLGVEAQHNVEEWTRYLDFTIGHLDSKAINIRELGKQVGWLAKFQPATVELPPRLKLTWLTVMLAEANHRGVAHEQSLAEYHALADSLYQEDAPLVCWASLHLAVQYTNAFQFAQAAQAVSRWHGIPPEVPGLKYHGQLQSTYGQHYAFVGQLSQARACFQQALAAFSRLSEPAERARNMSQTRAYLLTVLMDLPDVSAEELEREMTSFFGMPVTEAAAQLAKDASDGKKYQHHILVRFLASHPEHQAVGGYVSRREHWSCGHGHPWALIQFYRGMLLVDSSQRRKWLEKSVALIDEDRPGLTLNYIGTVLAGALYSHDRDVREDYVARLQKTRSQLPGISGYLQVLDDHLRQPLPPMELVKKTLPFNFR